MPLYPMFRSLVACAVCVAPAGAAAQSIAGFDVEGTASAELYATAGSGAIENADGDAGEGRVAGVIALGTGIAGRIALLRPTPEQEGRRTTVALLPGATWTDRWGVDAGLSLGATLDEWALTSTRTPDAVQVDVWDVGEPARRPIAIEQDITAAVGVGEVGQRLSYQGPVRFTDRIWLSRQDLLDVGVLARVSAIAQVSTLRLMGVGVAYDALLEMRDATPTDALTDPDATRRARSAVAVSLAPVSVSFRGELVPVELAIGTTHVVTHTFHRASDAGVPAGATALDAQFEALSISGIRVGSTSTLALVGGASVMSPAHIDEPAPSEIALWGEEPAQARRSSVGPLWGIELTSHRESRRVVRPFGDAAGVVSSTSYPAWTAGVHSFHRLDPTGLAVDAGVMASAQRQVVVPGGVTLSGTGSIVYASRHLVSDLAPDTSGIAEGEAFWLGRLELGLDRKFGDHLEATMRAWAERSDRATVTTPGVDDITTLRGDLGALVGLRLTL